MPTLSAEKQVLIVNHENKCFDYVISINYTDGGTTPPDINFIEKAIYNYIEEISDLKNYFLVSKDLWEKIVIKVMLDLNILTDDKIEFINSLITVVNFKIKKIFIVNTATYPSKKESEEESGV